VDQAVTTATYNDQNQLVSQAGGGLLRVRGHLNEPGTATVNAVPASVLPGNAFESTTSAATGTNTIAVVGTDVSSNSATQNYQVTVSGVAATYSYDPNGNLTQKIEGSDTWTYEWDAEDQLKRVLKNGVEQARFAYDPLGRRVEKVAAGVTTSYTYDGDDILREISGATTVKYIHGPEIDEPLAHEDGAGALSYFHADGLGSIIKTTNSAGAVTTTRRYDAYGKFELGAANGYAFTGREWDSETGLYYYRARYYDPTLGRFIGEDPSGLENDINFYRYVFNNPLTWVDPTGYGAVPPRRTPSSTAPPVPCRYGSFGGPPGCIKVPDRLPTLMCPVPPQKCTPVVNGTILATCLAYNIVKPSIRYPNPLGGNRGTGAGLLMQCILAATVCAEGGMPPHHMQGPSGSPGPNQVWPHPRNPPWHR
jgi:RHS repeat-associated protein